MINQQDFERLLTLLNEKEVLLTEREIALQEQQEEFMAQKEELNAAVEEVVSKNAFLSNTLEELKQRNHELDQILYRTSHDLKTPVSSLLGLISLLQATATSEEHISISNHLLQQTRQMASLLTSLSNLSKAFYDHVIPEKLSVRELVFEAWRNLKADNHAILDNRIDDTRLCSYKSLLDILISSILENAIQYALENSPPHIVISGRQSDSSFTLEIGDYGEEIAPELSDKIFDMFYRGSIRSKGPGLGLYIAKRITERLGGSIHLVNEKPLKRFVVTIPQMEAS